MAVSEMLLRSCSLFKNLSAQTMSQMVEAMELVQLKKREVFLAGAKEAFQGIGVVLQGRLQAVDYTMDGREAALTTVEVGTAFGHANLLARSPVDLTWVAVTPCTLAVLSRTQAQLLLAQADLSRQLAGDLAQQVCDFLGLQKIMSTHSVHARVCAWLLWQAAGKFSLAVPKHAELAWRLNTTRESITRTLQKLQADGVLRRDGDVWVVEDGQTLSALALGGARDV